MISYLRYNDTNISEVLIMKKISLTIVALFAAVTVNAGNVDGSAVLGSMVGAGVGSAVGSSIGGKEGAIIGGGAGGALGAAVGSTKESSSRTVTRERVIYVDGDRDHRDNGKHKGHYKHHGHDQD